MIFADQLAPVLANLCGFKLIITDHFAVVQQIKSPALPSHQKFQTSTFSLQLWASTMRTTVVSHKNSRNLLKICF